MDVDQDKDRFMHDVSWGATLFTQTVPGFGALKMRHLYIGDEKMLENKKYISLRMKRYIYIYIGIKIRYTLYVYSSREFINALILFLDNYITKSMNLVKN
jgi:hypothetical protein